MSELSVLSVDGKLKPDELQAWFAALMEPVQSPSIPELVIVSKGTYAHSQSVIMTLGEDNDKGRSWRDHLADGKALACRHSHLASAETREMVKEPTFAGVKFGDTKLLNLERLWGTEVDYAERQEQPIYLVVSDRHVAARKKARKSRNDWLADDPLTEAKIKKGNTFEIPSPYKHKATFIFADQISAEDRAFLLDLWEKERKLAPVLKETTDNLNRLINQFRNQIDPKIKEAFSDEEIVKASDLEEARAEAEKAKIEHEAILKAETEKSQQIRAEIYEIEVKKAIQQTRWMVFWMVSKGTVIHGPYIGDR